MKQTESPKLMPIAFGVNSQRQSLQESSVSGTSLASYNDGFPPITMISKDAGGIPPQGKDFNQILYELSSLSKWSQSSGLFQYDSSFSESIGGYPKGSVIIGADGETIYQSKIDDNLSTPSSGDDWSVIPSDSSSFVTISGLGVDSGYLLVGGFYSQEGVVSTDPSVGDDEFGRYGSRGQFDIIPSPQSENGLAGITFGGDNNRGTITIDELGQIRSSSWESGRNVSRSVLSAHIQSLGYQTGPYSLEGVMIRTGNPDESPTVIIDYDSSTGLPILVVTNPQQFGEYGYPNPSDEGNSYNVYPTRLQVSSSISSAISSAVGSYNKYFTYPLPANDKSSHSWVPVATFTTATGSGNSNGVFKALITVSGNVFPNGRSYLISGNSRGLSSVTLSSSNVDSYFNITALDAPKSDDSSNSDYIVSAGVTQSGNTVILYLKMPYSCAYSTIQALNVGYSGYVSYNPSSFSSLSSEPSGISYLTVVKPYNSSNVTVSSDGSLMAASPIVRVATNDNTSDRQDINSNGFNWSGSGTVNGEASQYSVSRSSTGTYMISNAKLATEGWQYKTPKSPTGGEDLAMVEVTDTDAGVQILVYERVMQISGTSVSIVKGSLIDVPSNSWVDVRLYEEPTTY